MFEMIIGQVMVNMIEMFKYVTVNLDLYVHFM